MTLHPAASGRIYAAYGGVYIAIALVWLQVVDGVKLDAFGQQKFQTTLKELEEERDAVKDLLPS